MGAKWVSPPEPLSGPLAAVMGVAEGNPVVAYALAVLALAWACWWVADKV